MRDIAAMIVTSTDRQTDRHTDHIKSSVAIAHIWQCCQGGIYNTWKSLRLKCIIMCCG